MTERLPPPPERCVTETGVGGGAARRREGEMFAKQVDIDLKKRFLKKSSSCEKVAKCLGLQVW